MILNLGRMVPISMHLQPQPVDYAKAITVLVAQMPLERAVQVYEYVRFWESQPSYPPPIVSDDEADWLNDSEEELQAEGASWEAIAVGYHEKFAALAVAARAEISAGTTQLLYTQPYLT